MNDVIGFDCNTKLTLEKARQFKDDGWDFVVRYVGRNTMADHDIDINEKDTILYAGLGLMLVQHCPRKGYLHPSKDLGTRWGTNAREFSKAVEYEKGCILYQDLEDVNPEYKNKQSLIYDYVNYWAEQVYKYYVPGVYNGWNSFLSGEQLYRYLKVTHYWRGYNSPTDIMKRGYSLFQYAYGMKFGIQIDKNIMKADNFGETPKFMKGRIIPVDPKEEIRKEAKELLIKELNLTFDYWDGVKYFDELLYKLGTLFEKWKKI